MWGTGRVPLGVDISDSNFNTVEKTGGSNTVQLSVEDLPAHTHTVGAHNHGLNSHTHAFTTGNQSANHTHSGTTGNQSAGHTHSIPALSGTAASAGAHTHSIYARTDNTTGGKTDRLGTEASHNENRSSSILSAGAHTHSVTTVANTSGGISANHTHSITTGANSASHTHSGITAEASGSTANSSQFKSGSNGSGKEHNNLQAYITCYMWKRTA